MFDHLLRRLGLRNSDAITIREIKRYVGRDDPVILELGANDGRDTKRLLKAFPKGKIFAFEPDPRAIAKWKKRIKSSRAQLFEAAIGAEDGTTEFHQSDGLYDRVKTGWDLSGSIRPPTENMSQHPGITFESVITVAVRTMDSWCEETGIEHIDFIWADLQGAERDFIAGAKNSLGFIHYLYTEYSEVELYEGQWNLDQLVQALPSHELIKKWPYDALFKLHRKPEDTR